MTTYDLFPDGTLPAGDRPAVEPLAADAVVLRAYAGPVADELWRDIGPVLLIPGITEISATAKRHPGVSGTEFSVPCLPWSAP